MSNTQASNHASKPVCAVHRFLPTEEPCSLPAVCRGMCKKHWTYCWKNALLPPRQPRPPRVLVKVYLSKEHVARLKRLMREQNEQLSTLLRRIVDDWLKQHTGDGDDAEGDSGGSAD